jgi:hypothetical protein
MIASRVLPVAATLLLLVACTAARETKSAASAALLSLARDAQALGAEYRAAGQSGRLSRERITAWNAYLVTFKAAYQRLEDRMQLATTEQLPAIQADTETLRAALARWRL